LLAPDVSSQDTLVTRALKNSQLTGGETYTHFGDRALARPGFELRIADLEAGLCKSVRAVILRFKLEAKALFNFH
jgi:hypothetical protein